MAYNEELGGRIGEIISRWGNIVPKAMFGGVTYLLNGNILCGVYDNYLILRLGEEEAAVALQNPRVREFDITGQPMKGWVMVEERATAGKNLKHWLTMAKAFADKPAARDVVQQPPAAKPAEPAMPSPAAGSAENGGPTAAPGAKPEKSEPAAKKPLVTKPAQPPRPKPAAGRKQSGTKTAARVAKPKKAAAPAKKPQVKKPAQPARPAATRKVSKNKPVSPGTKQKKTTAAPKKPLAKKPAKPARPAPTRKVSKNKPAAGRKQSATKSASRNRKR